MGLIFTQALNTPMFKTGIDTECPPYNPQGAKPNGGWEAKLVLYVKAENEAYNTDAYELKEEEVNSTAGGSLSNLADKPHNAQPAKSLKGPITDVAGTGDDYYWEGEGYVQWEIPYKIIRTEDNVTVEEGSITQRFDVDEEGKVKGIKGGFELTLEGNLPAELKNQ